MSKDVEKSRERTLILCVDRDDDLGAKVGVKTPVMGRNENLSAATNLALKDPEEADANAIFEAVRIYDRLSGGIETQESYQIATVTGSGLGGFGADKKLVAELTEVLKAFPADDVILVTDGYSDEVTLPLIQSRVPVASVKRVVMKHSESIEETAALFSKYLKTLVDNPRYSRFLVGLPGVLMLVLVALWFFNLLLYAWIALLVVIGSLLFVKGFQLDKTMKASYRWMREFSPPPLSKQMMVFSFLAGILLIGVGLYQGGAFVSSLIRPPPSEVGQWLALLPNLVGEFLAKSITLIVIGFCVILTGRAIQWFFEKDTRLLRTIIIIVTLAWSQQIIYQVSRILIDPDLTYSLQWDLVAAIFVGILLSVVTFGVTLLIHRKYSEFFMEKREKFDSEES